MRGGPSQKALVVSTALPPTLSSIAKDCSPETHPLIGLGKAAESGGMNYTKKSEHHSRPQCKKSQGEESQENCNPFQTSKLPTNHAKCKELACARFEKSGCHERDKTLKTSNQVTMHA